MTRNTMTQLLTNGRGATATRLGIAVVMAVLMAQVSGSGWAHEDALPEGPIKERHELMEKIGKNAKAISEADRAGDVKAMVKPAETIAHLSGGIAALFPEGSTDPKSRAKPEIWQNFAEFEAKSAALGKAATALAETAAAGGDVSADVKALGMSCKSCHDKFRLPKD